VPVKDDVKPSLDHSRELVGCVVVRVRPCTSWDSHVHIKATGDSTVRLSFRPRRPKTNNKKKKKRGWGTACDSSLPLPASLRPMVETVVVNEPQCWTHKRGGRRWKRRIGRGKRVKA